MKLDEMKKIAEARTKGEWLHCDNIIKLTVRTIDDGKFISMAANNWDKLMAVIEAVKEIYDHPGHGEDCPAGDEDYPGEPCECGADKIRGLLKALEQDS